MKKTLLCATAAAAFASAGFAAHAQDGWYGRADAQYGFSGRLDHDPVASVNGKLGGDSDADENLGGQLGFGYAFDNGFRLEATGGYRAGDLDVSPTISGVLPVVAGQPAIINPTGSMNAADGFINGYFDFNRAGNFQPYIGVGVGGMKVKAKASNRVGGTVPNQTARNGFADTDTATGYQGMFGFGYKLTERIMLDLGYKFTSVEDLDFEGVHNGVDYSADYTEHGATLGLRMGFGAVAAPPPPMPEPEPEPAPLVEPEPAPPEPPPPAPPPTAPIVAVGPACSTLNQNFVVYFEWDKSDLTSQASAVIDQAVANIRANSACAINSVSIVGHTDSSGGNAYNDRLAARRADVVSGALTAKGIDAASISKAGRGESQLAKATGDGVREPLNRRSEVTIVVR